MKILTHKEFSSRGGKTTVKRYKDKLSEWGKLGAKKKKNEANIKRNNRSNERAA